MGTIAALTTDIILSHVLAVEKYEATFEALAIDERLAVALALNRPDLLRDYTMLEAVERLGPAWTKAALSVQRTHIGGRNFLITYTQRATPAGGLRVVATNPPATPAKEQQ
jgi:hypothetical protein